MNLWKILVLYTYPHTAIAYSLFIKVKAGWVQKNEVEALGFECDVSSEASVQETVRDVEGRLGGIDVLVTAAG